MNDIQKGLIVWAIILAAGIGVGLGIGWRLWSPKPVAQATYQPAIQQPDGSQVVEVKPDPNAKPPHQIPHGGTVEDVVHVVVQPNPNPGPLPHSGSGASGSETTGPAISVPGGNENKPPCPPVRVDLSLVRMDDGTRRVVASSPDGQIVGAVHIPVEAAKPQAKALKWAAGVVYGSTAWGDTAKGAFLDRDLAFMRAGIEVTRNTYSMADHQGWEFRAKFGIRF